MKIGIMGKVALMFVLMGVLLIAGISYASYTLNNSQVERQYTQLALNSARMAANLTNGDSIERYLKEGEDDEYRLTYERLCDLKKQYGLKYLYMLVPATEYNDTVYVFDVYIEGDDPELIMKLGDTTGWLDVYDIVLKTYLTGQGEEQSVITNTEFGYLSSAYVPLYASDGTVTAVVGVDIAMDRIMAEVRSHTFQVAVTAGVIIVLFLMLLLFFVNRQILNPIHRLSIHMETLTSTRDELSEIPVAFTGDELQSMCESFNRMVGDLHGYIQNLASVTADRERVATELNVASQIQASMLPCIFPPFPERKEFDIFATMLPAKEVGGDFYDFFLVDEYKLAVVIADVSGKGVPAALFMVIAKTLIKNNASLGKSPKEVFEAVNSTLCENNEAGMFVTAFMGYLDIRAGSFVYVNAGHNRPLIKRAAGSYEFLKTKPCFVLAGFDSVTYWEEEISFAPGDALYLYTDGVTEAMNINKELFSDPRLLSAINKYKDSPISEQLAGIKKEIDDFVGDAEQADDITMLMLKVI